MARHKDDRPTATRIASAIRALIMSGEWEPGSKLPTTAALMEEHGTSNVTIQRALKILKGEEMLVGRSGSGVYVREQSPQIVTPATYINPGDGEAETRWGVDPSRRSSTRLISVGEVAAPRRVSRALGEGKVVRRARLGLLDGEPAEVTRSFYPASWARGTELSERRRIRGGSPAVLKDLGRTAVEQEDEIAARSATTEEYVLLELSGDIPVLEVFRVMRDAAGSAVEVSEIVKPGHLYKMGYRMA